MLYVLQMKARGDCEHSYVLGVFDSKKKAEMAGVIELRSRSNKPYTSTSYEANILRVEVNYPLSKWSVDDWFSEEISHDESINNRSSTNV